MEFIITLAVLTFMFWIGYHVTGALLSAAIWLFIKLPIAILLFGLGMALCITILLIPIGGKCMSFAGRNLFD